MLLWRCELLQYDNWKTSDHVIVVAYNVLFAIFVLTVCLTVVENDFNLNRAFLPFCSSLLAKCSLKFKPHHNTSHFIHTYHS